MLISYNSRQAIGNQEKVFYFIVHWAFNGRCIDVDNATNSKSFNRSGYVSAYAKISIDKIRWVFNQD